MSDFKRIKDVLPVNSCTKTDLNVKRNNVYVDKEIKNNVINVDDLSTDDLVNLLSSRFVDEAAQRDWLADELAKKLNDLANLNYYKSIAKQHTPGFLLECLSFALDAQDIRTTRARYFVGIVKRRSNKK